MAEAVKVIDTESAETSPNQMDTPNVREIGLSESQETALKAYLEDEIRRAMNDRSTFMDRMVEWQAAYDAESDEEAASFPFEGASNLTVPVIKETVNTLTAQLSQTIITPSPRWTVKTENAGWRKFAGLIERFLDRASREDIKIDDNLETWILEGSKYGTSILQVTYEKDIRKVMVFSRDGKKARPVTRIVKEGPRVYNVPLQDFIIPFSATEIDEAKWVAKRFRLSGLDLKRREKRGIFRNVSNVLTVENPLDSVQGDLLLDDPVLEFHEDREDTVPTDRNSYEIYEWWGTWELENDFYEIRVYYHLRTNTILRVEYHPYWHGKRPFLAFRYFPVEYRFYGQGLCEQLEAIQEEITTIHKQRLDNATLANTRMFKSKKLSGSLKPGDPIFPSQIIEVVDMDDVEPFQLGEVYPSTFENEALSRSYAERLSGVNDVNMRGGMPVSRTTASAQAALLQEQGKRFDQAIRKIRAGLKELADLIFMYYFQFGVDEGKAIQWLGEKGKAIVAIFSLSYETVDQGLGFEASAPTSQLNKEQQRQQALAVFNLLVQLYDKFFVLLGNIQIPPQILAIVAGSMAKTAREHLWTVLERFDVQNPEEALATLAVIERILPAPEQLRQNEDIERQLADAEILEQIQQLENTLLRASGTSGRDIRLVNEGE